MAKEIHFYTCTRYIPDHIRYYDGWEDTQEAIYTKTEMEIHTSQMGLLSTTLFVDGFKIFIHDGKDSMYEIKLGPDNDRGDREIRIAHNLFVMWKTGVFDKLTYKEDKND